MPTDRPLSIVHVHSTDLGGGAEHVAKDLCEAQAALGCRTRLVVGRKRTDDERVIEIPRRRGVPGAQRLAKRIERRFGLQYLYAPGFRALEEVLPEGAQVLHIHSLHGAAGYADIGALPRLARGRPCVLYLHDAWMLTGHCAHPFDCGRWETGCGRCPHLDTYPAIPRDGTRLNWLRKRWVLSRCPDLRVATPSKWLAERVRRSPIFQGRDVEVVPNGIDVDVFHPGRAERVGAVAELRPGTPVIMIAANHIENRFKNIDDAVTVLNRLEGEVACLAVGRGAAEVAKRVRCRTVAVDYVTDRDRMAALYRSADIFLLPSLAENFPLAPIEAMACGTAVVGYATGGIPEIVDGTAGVLVESANRSALARAVEGLLGDRSRLEALRTGAARRAKRFSLETQARTFVELYRRMIGNGAPAGRPGAGRVPGA